MADLRRTVLTAISSLSLACSSPTADRPFTPVDAPLASALTDAATVRITTPSSAVVALAIGSCTNFTAEVKDFNGNVVTDGSLTVSWVVNNSQVALATGTTRTVPVCGINNGFAYIQAQVQYCASPPCATIASNVVRVDVGQPIDRVLITPNPVNVQVGGSTVSLTATVVDRYGTGGGTRSAAWLSASPTIAAVTPTTGVVTGLNIGSTTISATVSGKTGTVPVNVTTTSSISPAVRTVFTAGNYTWTATAAATGTFTYSWSLRNLQGQVWNLGNGNPKTFWYYTNYGTGILTVSIYQGTALVGQATATVNNAIPGSCRFSCP